MCGIAGFYNLFRFQFKIDEELLHLMQKKLQHRGPDDRGFFVSDKYQIGLTHSRLSIVDLSKFGQQPMIDKEKTVVISFNGEIYNHLNLRSELENLGYKYFSNTDTETLIYAYKQWGIDFLHKLDGMFAFALFDLQKKELYLVRDRIGIKPLYFAVQNGILSFASEIKALDVLPWINKKISDIAFYHYLTFMIPPAPYTIFDDIYKLPAGFYAKIDSKKNITFHEWYNPVKKINDSEKKEFNNESFCIEKIDNLLQEAVKKRMMADVPVGAFLSGGIDSSLIVALMSQHSTKLKTFNVAFKDSPEIDESMWAKKVADNFSATHHQILISEQEAFDFYEKMLYHLDEPLADCVCIPFYFVSKICRENNVPVALVGEGADELFFGYPTYAKYKKFNDFIWQPTKKLIPGFLKKGLYKTSKLFFRKNLNVAEVLHNWSNNKFLYWGGAIGFNELQKNKILNSGFFMQKSLNSDSIVQKIYAGLKSGYDSSLIIDYHLNKLQKIDDKSDFLKRVLYLEFKQRLPELLLMRADKMSMAVGLEARVPYLDHKLVEFMFNVPGKLKFKNNQTKYLLKKVAEKYLPKEIIYRKKVGFAAPTVQWFNEGKYFPAYYEKKSGKIKSKIFDAKDFYNKYKAGESVIAVQKWILQNFAAMK
ncbi:MAG: asparagine synthase (glutamine-hydrolyzing) [bacterium]